MIFKKTHHATDRHSIDMHVNRGHENRNLFSSAFQIFVLLGFFNHNYLTIGWGQHVFIISSNRENRISKKLKYDQIENYASQDDTVLHPSAFREVVEYRP